jgi:hypothetical protein
MKILCWTVQHKSGPRARWRPTTHSTHHHSLDEAVASVCRRDPDGFFCPTLRVVDGAGEVVMTSAQWRKEKQ